MTPKSSHTAQGLPIIRTARSATAINEAARAGFFPLVRPVQPSPEIRSVVWVWQNTSTGEIDVIGDLRRGPPPPGWRQVLEPTAYYPGPSGLPFAAYLIPPDLQPGERVWVEDLIEDLVGISWNGNGSRLPSREAVWDGKDLHIDYDPRRHRSECIG